MMTTRNYAQSISEIQNDLQQYLPEPEPPPDPLPQFQSQQIQPPPGLPHPPRQQESSLYAHTRQKQVKRSIINIITYNTGGNLNDYGNLNKDGLIRDMINNNIDIGLLQETYVNSGKYEASSQSSDIKGVLYFERQNNSNQPASTSYGQGFYVNERFRPHYITHKYLTNNTIYRNITRDLAHHPKSPIIYTLQHLYEFREMAQDEEKWNNFYLTIERFRRRHKLSDITIGDLSKLQNPNKKRSYDAIANPELIVRRLVRRLAFMNRPPAVIP